MTVTQDSMVQYSCSGSAAWKEINVHCLDDSPPGSLVLWSSCSGSVTQDKARFLGFRSWPRCCSDRAGEKRSGSSELHSHRGDQKPCCTILEIFPCNKNSKYKYKYSNDCNVDWNLDYENTWSPPTPEVHSGDMCEPGPPGPAGLEEVLWLQHHPPHCSHAWAVIVFDGHTHQRTGAFTQVCAPGSEGAERQTEKQRKAESLVRHWMWECVFISTTLIIIFIIV